MKRVIEEKPISEEVKFKEGDIVEPIKNTDYKGNQLIRYDSEYIITSLRNDRAVLSAKRGEHYYVWAAFNINNIRKVEK